MSADEIHSYTFYSKIAHTNSRGYVRPQLCNMQSNRTKASLRPEEKHFAGLSRGHTRQGHVANGK